MHYILHSCTHCIYTTPTRRRDLGFFFLFCLSLFKKNICAPPIFVTKAPVRHTLQPLCDLSATDNLHQSQRSQQGPRSVPARLQRSRRLIGDLVATKSVAARFLCLHKNLAATDLIADRSRQSRRPVPDQSPTDRRLILLESGRGYHWNWSAIGRRLIGDLSATSLQLVGDLSATCSKMYSIS